MHAASGNQLCVVIVVNTSNQHLGICSQIGTLLCAKSKSINLYSIYNAR